MSQISASLFPAALKMQHAEASFERMKKRYGDAVVLQDAKSLDGAEKDAEATAGTLDEVKTALASSPELSKQADGLIAQFASIRPETTIPIPRSWPPRMGPATTSWRKWARWAKRTRRCQTT
jgi:hypothetical protein